MTAVLGDLSQCVSCIHFRPWWTGGQESTCSAYHGGIPDALWLNAVDHRGPADGDNGVRWESDEPYLEWALPADADEPDRSLPAGFDRAGVVDDHGHLHLPKGLHGGQFGKTSGGAKKAAKPKETPDTVVARLHAVVDGQGPTGDDILKGRSTADLRTIAKAAGLKLDPKTPRDELLHHIVRRTVDDRLDAEDAQHLQPVLKLSPAGTVKAAAGAVFDPNGDGTLELRDDPGWSEAEKRRHVADLRAYRDTEFEAVNGLARGNLEPALEAHRDIAQRSLDGLGQIFDHSPLSDDVDVWRGISNGRRLFGDRLDGNLIGFEWRELAPTSTSANESIARRFTTDGEGVLLRLTRVPKGTGAIYLSGREAELLLQGGLHLRVSDDHGNVDTERGIYRLLDVEVLT